MQDSSKGSDDEEIDRQLDIDDVRVIVDFAEWWERFSMAPIFPPDAAGGDVGALGEDKSKDSSEAEEDRPGQRCRRRIRSPDRPVEQALLVAPTVPPVTVAVGAEGSSSRDPLWDLD